MVTWDPGGKLAREEIVETKGPVEAKAVGIDTRSKTRKKPWPCKSQVSQVTPPRGVNHAPYLAHAFVVPSHCRYCTRFPFRGPHRGRGVVLGDVEAEPLRQWCQQRQQRLRYQRHRQSAVKAGGGIGGVG